MELLLIILQGNICLLCMLTEVLLDVFVVHGSRFLNMMSHASEFSVSLINVFQFTLQKRCFKKEKVKKGLRRPKMDSKSLTSCQQEHRR